MGAQEEMDLMVEVAKAAQAATYGDIRQWACERACGLMDDDKTSWDLLHKLILYCEDNIKLNSDKSEG